MKLTSFVKLHRLRGFAVAMLSLLLVSMFFTQGISIPAADGLRLPREMLLAFSPPLLCCVCIPVLPDLGQTLPRGILVARLLGLAAFGGGILTAVPLWLRQDIHGGRLEYESAIFMMLSATSLMLARRLETRGTILAAAFSMIVILYWNGLAILLGFAGFDTPFGTRNETVPRGHIFWVLSAAALLHALWSQPARPHR